MIERERERDLTLLTQLTEIFFNGSMFFFFFERMVGSLRWTSWDYYLYNLYIYTSLSALTHSTAGA
jgi:hypothetical protein